MRNELLDHPDVLLITDLTSRLVACMELQGCYDIKVATRKHIRRKLEAELGDPLHITSDGKLVVYPDNLSTDILVLDFLALKTELNATKSSEKDLQSPIKKLALQMRADVKGQYVNDEWPPQPSELTPESARLPSSLMHFLNAIITGEKGESAISERVERQINSFGQDIVYAVTGDTRRPPKHVQLPLVVKSLTGNVELIQMRNRLRHCVYCAMIEQIETNLCLQKLASESNENVILSANINPHVFTTLLWDNIDRLEETLTSHRVNGIAIHPAFIGRQLPVSKPQTSKNKKRSINVHELHLAQYNAGERVGPPQAATLDVDTRAAVENVSRKNHVWMACRLHDRNIPSWTGFNILIQDSISIRPDTVAYLPQPQRCQLFLKFSTILLR